MFVSFDVYVSLFPSIDPAKTIKIDPDTGALTVVGILDRESISKFTYKFKAVDKGTHPLTATTEVQIIVTDVNDNPPKFQKDLYVGEVDENSPGGVTVATVVAKDADSGKNAEIQFSLLTTKLSDLFTIGKTSGVLKTKETLSLKDSPDFNLTVIASDQGVPVMSSNVTVEIKTRAVNTKPVFVKRDYTFKIEENTPKGTMVGEIVAVDNDAGDDGELVYAYVKKIKGYKIFDVETVNNTGLLKVVANRLDREYINYFKLQFSAADGGSPSLKDFIEIEVFLTDVNDATPSFAPYNDTLYIMENVNIGYELMDLDASDLDQGENGSVIYYTEPKNEFFDVDRNTGVVTLSKTIPPNSISEIKLTVVSSDEGSTPLTAKAQITVNIVDVNEPPFFIKDTYSFEIMENTASGIIIGTIEANDTDRQPNSILSYSIDKVKTGNNVFQINDKTGDISIVNVPDREIDSVIVLLCKVLDGGTPKLKDETEVTIIINDENDNSPIFSEKTYTPTILETANVGSTLTTVHATDKDSGKNQQLIYSIEPKNEYFVVDDKTGEITLIKSIPLNTLTDIEFNIMSTDQGMEPKKAEAKVTVTVVDVNEAPVFGKDNYEFNIVENEATGTFLGQITAKDNDLPGNSKLTYKIVRAETGANVFTIESESGKLSVSTPPDRETDSVITLLCKVEDNGSPPLSDETTVKITITDLNDNTPVFTKSSYSAEIIENTGVGQTILTVDAEDKDSNENGELVYQILSSVKHGDRAIKLFSINKKSGDIVISEQVDVDQTLVIDFDVEASDMGKPPKSSKTNIKINILPFVASHDVTTSKTTDSTTLDNKSSGNAALGGSASQQDQQTGSGMTPPAISALVMGVLALIMPVAALAYMAVQKIKKMR